MGPVSIETRLRSEPLNPRNYRDLLAMASTAVGTRIFQELKFANDPAG